MDVCGGDSPGTDECDVCGGPGIRRDLGHCDCDGNKLDCAGVCGGDKVYDECHVCGGPGIRKDLGHCNCLGDVEDCLHVCGGRAKVDECGVCGG